MRDVTSAHSVPTSRRSIRVLASVASAASVAAFVGYCAIGTTAAGVAAVAVPACTITDDSGITPITGIVVRASTLVAGYGCGTGAGQIYKYSVVVSTFDEAGATQVFIAGGTYDCFADATFVNLCSSSSGNFVFNVNVYAFTEAQWNAPDGGSLPAIQGLLANHASYCTYDAGRVSAQVSDQGVRPDNDGGIDDQLLSRASFATTCTATQESSAEVVAVCAPVTAVP
jgi:hypothetical protein